MALKKKFSEISSPPKMPYIRVFKDAHNAAIAAMMKEIVEVPTARNIESLIFSDPIFKSAHKVVVRFAM